MEANQCFFGFEFSADLYHSSVATIKDIHAAERVGDLNRRAAENVIAISDHGFEAYYSAPSALITISPMLRKAADAGVHAVQKAIHLVIRKVLQDTPLNELKTMATYMGNLLCTRSDGRRFVCFELPEELYVLAQTLLARVRSDTHLDAYRGDLIRALERLIEAGLDAYYGQPVSQVKLGRITRAASDLGMKTAQKGANAVVHKLFQEMPHSELLPLASYFETLLHREVVPYGRTRAA